MLGKLKSMLNDLRARLINFAPFKGAVLKIEGNGAANPTILVKYNIFSITRTGVGIYNISLLQQTYFGQSLVDNGTHSVGFNIEPNVGSEAYFVSIKDGGGNTFDLTVTELVLGGGNKLEVLPYDIISGDTIDITVLINAGLGRLPPS